MESTGLLSLISHVHNHMFTIICSQSYVHYVLYNSTGDDLVDNKSGQVLGVQSAADDFGGEAESIKEVDDNGNYISSCDSTSEEDETKCTTNSWTKLDLQHGKAMVEDCAKDRTVHLTRMFSNEREMHYAICPVQEGYSVAFGKGPLVQQGPNKRVYYPTVSIDTSKGMIVIKPNDEGTNYEITGGAISNSVGFPCDRDADCDATLECKFECVHKTS